MTEKIKEIVIVEGREDERALKRACDVATIATHGFGISQETWGLIEKAYLGPGIIVMTDPDLAGDRIRKRIQERFPDAKHAYLARTEAKCGNEIGVEHANPDAILDALSKARCRLVDEKDYKDSFTVSDLWQYGLIGIEHATERRDKLGHALGIGYGNTKTFLERLNHFGITREEFDRHGTALFQNHNQSDQR